MRASDNLNSIVLFIAFCYTRRVKTVSYGRDAAKDLRRHGNVAKRIMEAVSKYAAGGQAHASNVKPLTGSTAKRLRVGDYRVIFDEGPTTITVTKIGPRGDVYK